MRPCLAASMIALLLSPPVRAQEAAPPSLTPAEVKSKLAAATEQSPPDLSGADLSGLELDGVDFRRTKLTKARLVKKGEEIVLSERECRLLQHLIESRGEVVTRDELLQEVWGYEAAPMTRTVDVHISWLRQKLEDDPANPRFIVTVHGQGYRFVQ